MAVRRQFESRHPSQSQPTTGLELVTKSGRQDSNLRPPAPKAGALARLRHAPNYWFPNTSEIETDFAHLRLVAAETALARLRHAPHSRLPSHFGIRDRETEPPTSYPYGMPVTIARFAFPKRKIIDSPLDSRYA